MLKFMWDICDISSLEKKIWSNSGRKQAPSKVAGFPFERYIEGISVYVSLLVPTYWRENIIL